MEDTLRYWTSNRGFTDDEDAYFAEGAQRAYTSFITKAVASRGMSVEDMNEVAQGRVWTGRQALNNGLVDRMGGMWAAIKSSSTPRRSRYRRWTGHPNTCRAEGGLPIPGVGRNAGMTTSEDIEYCVDDCVLDSDLVSADSLGVPPAMSALGIGPLLMRALQKTGLAAGLIAFRETRNWNPPSLAGIFMALEDAFDSFIE